MAIYPGTKKPEVKEKKNVAVPLIIVAGVLLLLLMGWLYQKSFGPAPVAPLSAAGQTNHDYIAGLYDRTNGDYSKVTDEEKGKLEKITSGHGQIAFQHVKD